MALEDQIERLNGNIEKLLAQGGLKATATPAPAAASATPALPPPPAAKRGRPAAAAAATVAPTLQLKDVHEKLFAVRDASTREAAAKLMKEVAHVSDINQIQEKDFAILVQACDDRLEEIAAETGGGL